MYSGQIPTNEVMLKIPAIIKKSTAQTPLIMPPLNRIKRSMATKIRAPLSKIPIFAFIIPVF